MSKKTNEKKEKKQVNKYLSDGKTKICKKCNQKQSLENFQTDNSSSDHLWRFCKYCEYTRKHLDKPLSREKWLAKKIERKTKLKKSKVTKKVVKPKTPKKIANVETIEAIEERIKNLSPTSDGLNIKNVTPEIKTWAAKQGYGWESEHTLSVGKKAA